MAAQANIEQAERRLQQFERRLLNDAIQVGHPDAPALVRNAVDLVGHAALPVVCDAEFLHLLRINFFVDADALPYWVEGRMLLSPLWQDLGDGLYMMEADLRRLLLQRLVANRGAKRTAEVATLLWRNAERRHDWAERMELRHAQQLTALNFLAPAEARRWLDQAKTEGGGESLDESWFVAMAGDLELPQAKEMNGDAQLMCDLLLLLAPRDDSVGLPTDSGGRVRILTGDPGSALQWQMFRMLIKRAREVQLSWYEVDPAHGQRLLESRPGQRDRSSVELPDSHLKWIHATSTGVAVIDHAERLGYGSLSRWYDAFDLWEVFLLFHSQSHQVKRLIRSVVQPLTLHEPWPKFDNATITRWFSTVADSLPPALYADTVGGLLLYVDALLKDTGGVPERVYERLCTDAGVRWAEVQAIARERLEPRPAESAKQALLKLALEANELVSKGYGTAWPRKIIWDDLVGRMRPLLSLVDASTIAGWGQDKSDGVLLLRHVWLQDHPDPAEFPWLVKRARKKQDFVGYHALLALKQTVHLLPDGDLAELDGLAHRLEKLPDVPSYTLQACKEIIELTARKLLDSLPLMLVDDMPQILPAVTVPWSPSTVDKTRQALHDGHVVCAIAHANGVGTLADVILDRKGSRIVAITGRERVRVTGARIEGEITLVSIEHCPEDPSPPSPEIEWDFVRGAMTAWTRLIPDGAGKGFELPIQLPGESFDALYRLLFHALDAKALQEIYATQDRRHKLQLTFVALTRQMERWVPVLEPSDAARVKDLIARRFTTPAEVQAITVALEPIDSLQWPPPLDQKTLACFLALRSNDEELWAAVSPLLDKYSKGKRKKQKPAASPLRLWPNGSTLRLRFLGGDPRLRKRVANIAQAWFDHANLKLEVLPARSKAESDIRVSFDEKKGSWSYVGTEAKSVPPSEPTMNLGWVSQRYPEANVHQSILKEFGHALGLIPELQNPNRPFEWNREQVDEDLKGPPNFWDEKTIETFLSKFEPFDYRPFDPFSVMLHPTPAQWTLDGTEVMGGIDLSDSDKALIARLYPKPTA